MPTTLEQNEIRVSDGGKDKDIWLHDGFGGDDRPPEPERLPPPEGFRIALWLTLISVTMLFLALTSAYVFNRAQTQPITMPKALWASTAIILVSSLTLELARRSLRRRQEDHFRRWIGVTLALGLGFLVAQLLGWRELTAAGFYVNRNFRSGYTYMFTALHGLHLLGGLIALAFVTLRAQHKWTALRRRVAVDVTALYWHFVDGLWIFLLVLLFFWR